VVTPSRHGTKDNGFFRSNPKNTIHNTNRKGL